MPVSVDGPAPAPSEQPAWADSLPPLPVASSALRGPTSLSNWVIPGRLIAGAYPGHFKDAEHALLVRALLAAGVEAFVCLQEEADLELPESKWRQNPATSFRPYMADARAALLAGECPKQRALSFVHFRIPDQRVGPDEGALALTEHLAARILRGETLYVHCWGGHGRTGTIVSLLLVALYGISADEALKATREYHDQREDPRGIPSPETKVQFAQVRRLAPQLLARRRAGPFVLASGEGGAHFDVREFARP